MNLGYHFDQPAQGWRAVRPLPYPWPVPHDIAVLLGLEAGAEVIIRDPVMDGSATGQATQLATS